MAKISSKKRHLQIKQKHKRKIKLKKLYLKYLKANVASEKKKILEKAIRLSPLLTKEEFLKSAQNLSAKLKSTD